VTCGAKGVKTFIYRYRSPFTNKLVQNKYRALSHSLAGRGAPQLRRIEVDVSQWPLPASEQRGRKAEEQRVQHDRQNQSSVFTVKDVVGLHLIRHIEDRKVNGKIIPASANPKASLKHGAHFMVMQ
jgi:hypothetical protein